jgi:hypothetical protein
MTLDLPLMVYQRYLVLLFLLDRLSQDQQANSCLILGWANLRESWIRPGAQGYRFLSGHWDHTQGNGTFRGWVFICRVNGTGGVFWLHRMAWLGGATCRFAAQGS